MGPVTRSATLRSSTTDVASTSSTSSLPTAAVAKATSTTRKRALVSKNNNINEKQEQGQENKKDNKEIINISNGNGNSIEDVPKKKKKTAVSSSTTTTAKKTTTGTGKKEVKKSDEINNDKKGREEDEITTDEEPIKPIYTSFYEFTANDLKTGEAVSLEKYKGHVCIIINVASRCGHTKSNYEQLNKLYEDYSESKGLRILAFPCNQFGSQEPGTSQQICSFIDKRNVKFDLFEKIKVNGKDAHPVYEYLKNAISGPKNIKDIKWNFTKFIVNKEGRVVERFTPATKPLSMLDKLEKYF